MKKALVFLPFLVALFALSAVAVDDTLVQFRGGIGVIPVSAGEGTAATADVVDLNIVRGVIPAPQIWVIAALRADVKVDGREGRRAYPRQRPRPAAGRRRPDWLQRQRQRLRDADL
jgi:hypothetical protein